MTGPDFANTGRIGLLLVNLGTPDEPTAPAVRRYLAEFLSDKRVVEIPPILWQPILRGAVLTTRPARSAHAYQQVWTENGSPLLALSLAQVEALRQEFPGVIVDLAMRYGKPAIGERIESLKAAGCDRILIAPLYPQYCASTTATAIDAVGRALQKMRWQPAIRTLPPYFDSPLYIEALASSIEDSLRQLDFEPDCVIASFHGVPARTEALGDPYHYQCKRTAELLAEKLSIPLKLSFQSRFGRARWLEPSTEDMLETLAKSGQRDIAILAPGFAVDCIETLEELALRGREAFMAAGGRRFEYLPCLNDSPAGMTMLTGILRDELAGWLPAA